MTADMEMTDTKAAAPAPNDDATSQATKPVTPPLEAAAQRLDRLLSSALDQNNGSNNNVGLMSMYTNPAKIVRRWLSTSSGATADATVADVQAAASKLLDPAGLCGAGRSLLVNAAEEAITEDAMLPYLSSAAQREVEAWLISLAVRLQWRDEKFHDALELSQKGIELVLRHLEDASLSITRSAGQGASSLFPLVARLYRWRALAAESGQDAAIHAQLRADMAKAHNMATLRRDIDSQATLLNCMLRDLLLHSQVEQAQKLLSNSTFPEAASNNQFCRYLYYSGRIQALRLDYTASFSSLSQCLRKAPTNTGVGFRITAQRLLVVVQLLMGEIPERHVFFQVGLRAELAPYLAITQAVRNGDLGTYQQVVSEHMVRFQTDKTYTLINRLAHQVVKAGLRKLHVSYSRLSLEDVAVRLGLPSAQSAEFVVAKAVRDGVLDATIYHEEGYVQSHDLVDVYATKEPAEAFHRRIAYCLTTHNDAVRGMRYPPDEYKKQLEASRGNRRKKDEDKTDEEKAQELEDEFDEDY